MKVMKVKRPMKVTRKFCLALVAILPFALPQWAQSIDPAGGSYAITNITVIDTTGGASHPGMTVVIDGARISSVGKGQIKLPKQAHVIDGTGKYLIPGLWDMHVHTFFRRLGAGRQRSHAAALHREWNHRRSRHGQRSRPDPRGASRRRLRRTARPAHDGCRTHARRTEDTVPRFDRDRDTRRRPSCRRHAEKPRRRFHQDSIVRPARGLLRHRR